jgi:kumamolisin
MIRRLSASLLTVIAMVSIVSIVGQAQMQSLMTRHVREVTVNGQAPSVGRLPATQVMRLVLVLPLRHQPELENLLQELYDPSSPSYRHFLTVQEFTARFGPRQEDYDAVIHFAEANGLAVVGTSRNRMNVDVKASVARIEKAFHVIMGVYQHPTESRTFYAPDREPTLDLPFQLWHISGLDKYSIPRPLFQRRTFPARSNATTGSGPSASFLGSDMRAAYYEGTALTGSGQSLGLLAYYGTDLADLNTYYKNVGQTNSVPITLLSTDGTSTNCVYPSCDDTEQTIDMTQALGMAPGLSSLVMYIGSTDSAIFNAMATASPLNAQLSSSWTWSPADPSTDNPYFEEFAAQGQNLFQAAGDSGKWSSSSEIYPADDVYVTSVGGTDLETSSAAGPWLSETAWVDGGGGISPDKFAIPSWQTAAANGCSSCSQTYRNGPDVSANANFTFYVCADQTTCTANKYGGTSFATPMWAGYLALANQQVVANGNPTLGFINPTLYTIGLGSSYDSDFHDITSGSNGLPTTTGYDLATGWGSPNGTGLINALAEPSTPNFTLTASPNSVTVTQGNNGTSTITVVPVYGFTGSVTLSAPGLPIGVVAGFNPNPTTTNSTLTLTASATAPTGTSTVTVTGVSGSLTQTTTLSLTVAVPSAPVVSLTPTSLAFAGTVVGAATAAKPVTLKNTGTATLNISSIMESGSDFQISSNTCGATLAVGKSCVVKVTFTPTQVGARTGSLVFNDNSLNSTQSVPLSGTGLVQATLTPASASYSPTKVGSMSGTRVFTLSNKQSVSLNSIVISTTGDFSVSATTCTTSLAAKSTCQISVVFQPAATGTRTGQLDVADSAAASPQVSNLTGTGK